MMNCMLMQGAHRKQALLILNLIPQLVQLLLLALGQIHLPRQVSKLLRVVRFPPLHVLRPNQASCVFTQAE